LVNLAAMHACTVYVVRSELKLKPYAPETSTFPFCFHKSLLLVTLYVCLWVLANI